MEPVSMALLGGAILSPIIGGIVGAIGGAGSEAEKKRLLEEASRQYNIPLPQLEQMVAEQLGPSQMEGVEENSMYRQAEEEALREMVSRGREGYNAQDRAAMSRVLGEQAQGNRAQHGALMEGFSARGLGGSGAELAAQLHSQSGQANRANTQALDIAAQGRQQALQALAQGGAMAGRMQGAQFQRKSAKAQAADEISRFNAVNRQQAHNYNIGLGQQQFDNRYRLASGKANAMAGQANAAGESADRTRATWTGIGQGVGQGAAAGLDYQGWDQDRRRRGGGGGY